MERRSFQRLILERPCTVRRDQPSMSVWSGVTHNIGRGGALISIGMDAEATLLEEGDELVVEMLLDKNRNFEQRCIQCRGPLVGMETDSFTTRRIRVHFETTTIRPIAESWLWTGEGLVS